MHMYSTCNPLVEVGWRLNLVCHDCRFELAKASRVWRQGVPTALVMDQSLHMLQDAAEVQVLLVTSLLDCSAVYTGVTHQQTVCFVDLPTRPSLFDPGVTVGCKQAIWHTQLIHFSAYSRVVHFSAHSRVHIHTMPASNECQQRGCLLLQEELSENLEFWATSPDVPPTNPLTEKAGDFRYYMVQASHPTPCNSWSCTLVPSTHMPCMLSS